MSKLENLYWGRNGAHICDFFSWQPLVSSHSPDVWLFDIWHLFDNLTQTYNLNHLSPLQDYFISKCLNLSTCCNLSCQLPCRLRSPRKGNVFSRAYPSVYRGRLTGKPLAKIRYRTYPPRLPLSPPAEFGNGTCFTPKENPTQPYPQPRSDMRLTPRPPLPHPAKVGYRTQTTLPQPQPRSGMWHPPPMTTVQSRLGMGPSS